MKRYKLQWGILRDAEGARRASLRRDCICLPNGEVIGLAAVDHAAPSRRGDVRLHEYRVTDRWGRVLLCGCPQYAAGEEPETGGWPLHRMPRADRVLCRMAEQSWVLGADGSLRDSAGGLQGQFTRRWGALHIEAAEGLEPALLCAFADFLRRLARENEWEIV